MLTQDRMLCYQFPKSISPEDVFHKDGCTYYLDEYGRRNYYRQVLFPLTEEEYRVVSSVYPSYYERAGSLHMTLGDNDLLVYAISNMVLFLRCDPYEVTIMDSPVSTNYNINSKLIETLVDEQYSSLLKRINETKISGPHQEIDISGCGLCGINGEPCVGTSVGILPLAEVFAYRYNRTLPLELLATRGVKHDFDEDHQWALTGFTNVCINLEFAFLSTGCDYSLTLRDINYCSDVKKLLTNIAHSLDDDVKSRDAIWKLVYRTINYLNFRHTEFVRCAWPCCSARQCYCGDDDILVE